MMTLFGPILAAALLAQFQGRTLQGTVVDDQGKPVAGAQVIFHAPAPWKGDAEPVEVRAKTDDEGRFRLTTSRMAGIDIFDSKVWAYRSGSAMTAVPGRRQPLVLVLRKPEPRIIKLEGPGGQPVVGRESPHEPSSSPRSLHEPASPLMETETCLTRCWPRRGRSGPGRTARRRSLAWPRRTN